MSETPRTDEQRKIGIRKYGGYESGKDWALAMWTHFEEFARQLERELAIVAAERDTLKKINASHISSMKQLGSELDRLNGAYEGCCKTRESAEQIRDRLRALLDEARGALELIIDWARCDRDNHGRTGMAGGYAIARAALAKLSPKRGKEEG